MANGIKQKIERETATSSKVEDQIVQIRDDIAALASTVASLGAKSVDRAKNKAAAGYNDALSSSEQALADLKLRARDVEKEIAAHVRNKPVQTLAIAAGIGFIAALLANR